MKKVDGRNWVKIKTKKEKKQHNLAFPITVKNRYITELQKEC